MTPLQCDVCGIPVSNRSAEAILPAAQSSGSDYRPAQWLQGWMMANLPPLLLPY